MSTNRRPADDAFTAWYNSSPGVNLGFTERERTIMQAAFISGWDACVAAQQHAFAEAKRWFEEGR